MGDVALNKYNLECKVCHLALVCFAMCHARIIYVHSIFVGMSRASINLGVHNHSMFNCI